ncbi:acetyl-CoA synthetase-like protein [Xylariaceae sp. FL1651]|nr:acetyl-CoA synthetase-like protein [Xylariaceae sp. FL1651]
MAATLLKITAICAGPSVEVEGKLSIPSGVDRMNSINDLILHRAEAIPNTPFITYSDSLDGRGSWVEYTARDLDIFADEAAKELTQRGLKPKDRRSSASEVVALLGTSNLDYAVTLIALSRMGFAVLFLSTRLPVEAFVALLEKTKCNRMVTTDQFALAVSGICEKRELQTFPLVDNSIYKRQPSLYPGRFQRQTILENEENCIAFIIHSSGSTGLPKPIFQTHRASLGNYAVGSGMRAFVTTPLFHNSGLSTFFRGIVASKCTAFHNAALPMTNANLVASMNIINPDSFHCVPYTLKLLSETVEGIDALQRCKVVITGGSSCPDELGDLLVNKGVYLVSHYGQTEMGQLMASTREEGDKLWNYLRPFPKTKPFLHFEHLGDNEYECVVLDGLLTKVLSNSDNPPNSYYTRDCFTPHPTRPDLWKYTGRLDDRLTLVNGEKVLPVQMEGRIRQNELIHECLIFGAGRAFPGLLVIPSEKAAGLEKSELLNKLMPTIEGANANAEQFSQIPREMVEILDADVDYPRTDKGTMIRDKSYKLFADVIDSVYVRFETPEDTSYATRKKLDLEGLKTYLLELFRSRLGKEELELETDFFSASIDSLQAIRARGHMMRELDLAGNIVKANAVYENANILKLAEYLNSLSNGITLGLEEETQLMENMVDKYGEFVAFSPGTRTPEGDVVLVTGVTGSLGAYVLAQLLPLSHVKRIFCLVRASDEPAATARVLASLHSRGLIEAALPESNFRKIVAVPSDLSRADLGLSPTRFSELQSTLTNVIHSAWAVNFNLGVASFENQHIRGIRNLLDLCLQVPFTRPARFSFISSVSAAAGTPPPAVISETYAVDPSHAQAMGYARSKWVAEHIVRRATNESGIDACVLRSGQLIGDMKEGRWNPTEAIPLMIRSATTLGALPSLDENPSWLPVDVCAAAVIELSQADKPFYQQSQTDEGERNVVYHVQNPRQFSWTDELLPALRDAGLEFETVGQREWVDRLWKGDQDPIRNPTVKLADFFTSKYDNDKPGRKGLVFDTTETERKSKAVASRVDVIGNGTIRKCVEKWRKDWR